MTTTGIIYNIQRFALQCGAGIRTLVSFKGCALHCPWCQDPEARRQAPELAYYAHRCIACGVCARVCPNHAVQLKVGEPHILRDRCVICGKCVDACVSAALVLTGARMSVAQVMVEVRKDRAYYEKTGGGLSISGGEPLQQADFLEGLLSAAREEGIPACLATSGYADHDVLERIQPLVSCFLYDYKATGLDYQSLCGIDEGVVLTNLDYLYHQGKNIVLRCPLVPGVNDTSEHLEAIARLDREYPDLRAIELRPYRSVDSAKFERYGYTDPLPGLKPPDAATRQGWLDTLEKLGCTRAKLVN